jgi:hypothetical protein
VVADEYPNFSICGIQFLVPGDVRDWRMLAHRSMADLEAAGVRLLLNTTANDVEVDARRLSVADGGRARVGLPDDELAIATGATPESPPIGGVDAPGQDDGVFLLHTMIYSWRYPESIHRSVMIGVNPPGHFVWDPETTDEQIQHYAAPCSKDASCPDRTDDRAHLRMI